PRRRSARGRSGCPPLHRRSCRWRWRRPCRPGARAAWRGWRERPPRSWTARLRPSASRWEWCPACRRRGPGSSPASMRRIHRSPSRADRGGGDAGQATSRPDRGPGRPRPPRPPGSCPGEDDGEAALAERGVTRIGADLRAPGPAPLTFLPAEALGRHHGKSEAGDVLALVGNPGASRRRFGESHRRHVEEGGQERLPLAYEERTPLLRGGAGHIEPSVDALADEPLLARGLEGPRDFAAHLEETLPLTRHALVDPLPALLGQRHQVHALRL